MKKLAIFNIIANGRTIMVSFGILFTSVVFGQTQTQKQQIRAATNTSVLQQLAIQFDSIYSIQKAEAVQWAIDNGVPIRDVLPDGRSYEIIRIKNGAPIYYVTFNENAAKTVSTNKVWTGTVLNLDGAGIIIGEWDGGKVKTNHQELIGNATQIDGATNINNHATHVAGTMIAKGIIDSAKGMASGAQLHAYYFDPDLSEMTAFAASGYLLSNHSYGIFAGWDHVGTSCGSTCTVNPWHWYGDNSVSPNEDYKFGFYNTKAKNFDLLTYNAPYYLIIQAAGNFRGDGPTAGTEHCYKGITCIPQNTVTREINGGIDNYDCIPGQGVAKNILTVGAVDDIPGAYTSPADVVMYSKSSWGPTDDGRIKPDLVANGINLYSCIGTSTTSYGFMTGTSMATPNVTGSLALLQQHYSNTYSGLFIRAATLKALVIHTADEAGTANGPDYEHGWGLLNTEKAANLVTLDSANCFKNIQELVLSNNDTFTFTFDHDTSQQFIKATIVWNDPAGTPVADTLNPPDLMLVNDLDLRIIRQSDGQIFYPWTLDPTNPSIPADTTQDNFRDNVEQVYLSTPTSGTYIVKVTHKATLQGVNPQAFSMIISGGVFDLSQVRVKISPTHVLCIGDSNGTATVIACGGTPPYTYLWSNGQTNDTATGLAAGNYSITVTDTNGIMVTDSVTINEPPAIIITMFTFGPFCNGNIDGSAYIGVNGGTPPYTYLWNTGSTTWFVEPVGAGTYTVTVTDANGCTSTDSATLIDPPVLIVTSSSIDALCNQAAVIGFGTKTGAAKATASGGTPGYSYLWNDSLVQTTDSATGLLPGIYLVTVTDINGCTAVDTAIINEPDSITLTTSTTNALCNGVSDGTATVTATGGTPPYILFRWFATPNQDSSTATGLAAGIYEVFVVDANFCLYRRKDTVFNDPPAYTVSVSTTDEICIGSANGTATAAVTGQTPPFTFLWDDSLVQTDSIADSLSPGIYTVTVTDSNGCIISATDTVSLLPQPEAIAGTDTTIFCGDSITFSAQPADTTLLYAWSPSSGLNDTSIANPIAFPVFTTQYVLTVTDTTTGCIDSDTVIITVNPLPIADAGPDTNILCGDSIIIGPQVVDTTLLYSWSPVTGLDNATIPNPTAFPSITTSYILTVTDTATSCINFANILITVGNPVAGAGPDITICRGDSITIGTQPFDSTFLFAWSPAAGLNDSTIAQPIASPDSTTAYLLTVTDTTTECVDYDTVLVSLPVFDFVNPVIDTIVYWQFGSFKVLGEVIIDSGGVLHMGWSKFEFSYDVINEAGFDYDRARIVIKPGGKLISNYDTLTGCGGGPWDGIENWGDKTKPQNNADQGVLVMNNTTIINAQRGIFCGRRSLINVKLTPHSGGIVRATNSAFINNYLAVKMRSYPDFNSISYFKNCNFEYNSSTPFEYIFGQKMEFINLFDHHGLKILGCHFINTTPGDFAIQDRGWGIKSTDASYIVDELCINQQQFPCPAFQPTIFENLYYGIEATATNSLNSVSITKSKFLFNNRGILLRGVDYAIITENEFDLGDYVNPFWSYSFYLENCTGYLVEGNLIHSTANTGIFGSYINNSGNGANEIYRNQFFDVIAGSIYDFNNSGLETRCNIYTNISSMDIGAVGSIALDQGFCSGNDNTTPAGNQFSYTAAQGDIIVTLSYPVNYNHHSNGNAYNTTPLNYTTPDINPNPCQPPFDPILSCPSQLPVDCGLSCQQALIINYENKVGALKNLFDGGDKDFLLAMIHQDKPAGMVKNALLTTSPYLTDRVLIAAINEKPTPLPAGALKEVIIANSPITDKVKSALDNRRPHLPKGINNEIETVQTGTSARAALEREVVYFDRRRELSVSAKIRYYLHSDTIPGAMDSVIAILVEEEILEEVKEKEEIIEKEPIEKLQPKRKLADAHLKKREFTKAQQKIDTLKKVSEFENFGKLKQVMIDIKTANENYFILKGDSVKEKKVRDVAADTTKYGYVHARAILDLVFNERVPEHFITLPFNNNARLANNNNTENTIENFNMKDVIDSQISVYPNPANETVNINYKLPDNSNQAFVNIYDIMGKKLYSLRINNDHGIISLDVSDLPNGLYFYTLIVNNNTIARNKLMIIK